MAPSYPSVLTAALVLLPALAADAYGQQAGRLLVAEAEFLRAATGQPPPGAQAVETTQPATVESAGASVEALNCEVWNTEAFFERATASVVRACLDARADPGAIDVYGLTPLHRAAAINDDPAVIGALLAAGADPTTPNREVDTPLDDDAEMVIRFGEAPPHSTDYRYYPVAWTTPLHYAARFNANPAVVEALLAAGAEVNARDDYYRTPLHYAASHKRECGGRRSAPGGRSRCGVAQWFRHRQHDASALCGLQRESRGRRSARGSRSRCDGAQLS